MEDINIGFYYKFVTCRVGDIPIEEFEFFMNWLKSPVENDLGINWLNFKLRYFDFLRVDKLSDKQSLTFQAIIDCYEESYKFDKEFMDYIFRQKSINDLLKSE